MQKHQFLCQFLFKICYINKYQVLSNFHLSVLSSESVVRKIKTPPIRGITSQAQLFGQEIFQMKKMTSVALCLAIAILLCTVSAVSATETPEIEIPKGEFSYSIVGGNVVVTIVRFSGYDDGASLKGEEDQVLIANFKTSQREVDVLGTALLPSLERRLEEAIASGDADYQKSVTEAIAVVFRDYLLSKVSELRSKAEITERGYETETAMM